MSALLNKLENHTDPTIRLKTLTHILGKAENSKDVKKARGEIRNSGRVRAYLDRRDESGKMPGHPYSKWKGAHWTLAALADLEYPPGDKDLLPLRDQVYEWLLGKNLENIERVNGRYRFCASKEGNAIWSTMKLGISDERINELLERLWNWQWADGGWNCDRRPEANNSSFMESLLPLRALAYHAKLTGSNKSASTALKAAEIFLKRKLFRRKSDGKVIKSDFKRLHYPCYWHYDILFGLKVLVEAGLINDPRCEEALDVLEKKRLPDGGFPLEAKYYRYRENDRGGPPSPVSWGNVDRKRMNEFVTVDALHVLKAAGRLDSLP